MQVEETNKESALDARPISPVDVHHHLISQRDEIIRLVAQQGQIDADKIMLSSGFDEDMMASEDVAAQCVYVSCSNDIHLTTEKIDAFLLALGNILAPFAGIFETPSQKFHSPFIPKAAGVSLSESRRLYGCNQHRYAPG